MALKASQEEAARLRDKLTTGVNDLAAAHRELREEREKLEQEHALTAKLQLEIKSRAAAATADQTAAQAALHPLRRRYTPLGGATPP